LPNFIFPNLLEKIYHGLELFSGVLGLIGICYGLKLILVERAQVPLCSLELLQQQQRELRLQQPKITVEVNGAVNEPGVWQFERGQRIGEALERAGGINKDANAGFLAKQLNLASQLKDGDKIYLPFIGEEEKTSEELSASTPIEKNISQSKEKISVNLASIDDLKTLNGIGDSRAEAIVANRPYAQLGELVSKKALSQTLFDELANELTL